MNISYIKLLQFNPQLKKFVLLFFICSVFAHVFSLFNFTSVMPALDILFGTDIKPDEKHSEKHSQTDENILFFNLKEIYGFLYGIIQTHGKARALMVICLAVIFYKSSCQPVPLSRTQNH